jgi:hypothetical protein
MGVFLVIKYRFFQFIIEDRLFNMKVIFTCTYKIKDYIFLFITVDGCIKSLTFCYEGYIEPASDPGPLIEPPKLMSCPNFFNHCLCSANLSCVEPELDGKLSCKLNLNCRSCSL